MATKKISFDIDESIFQSLGQRFPDLPGKDKVAATLAKLALTEWEQWFAARLRPNTIFQDPSLYSGKRVTRGMLFNQFNLPYGEASYLERVFAEKELPDLSQATLGKILDELGKQVDKWKKDTDRKPDQEFTIEVDKLGQRLLQAVMQKAKADGKDMAPAEHSLNVHGYYNYTFSKEEADTVIKIGGQFKEAYGK